MPDLSSFPAAGYDPKTPYHYFTDSLPLQLLDQKISLVNFAVDNVSTDVNAAVGTTGSLDARISKSLNPDGTLIAAAVDTAMHHYADHVDDDTYARFTQAERSKLSLMANDATNLSIQFDTGISGATTPILITEGVVEFVPTPGVTWTVTNDNKVQADLNFSLSGIHTHYYDQLPVAAVSPPDYKTYNATSSLTTFTTGSLRVKVNGRILSRNGMVSVPLGTSGTATALSFAETNSQGFTLTSAVTATDLVTIDFDVPFVSTDTNDVVIGMPGPQGAVGPQGPQGSTGNPLGPYPFVNVSTTYTVQPNDLIIRANAFGGAFSISLPPAAGNMGREVLVKKVDATSNVVTVVPQSGNLIDGQVSHAIGTAYGMALFFSNGSSWDILEKI